MFTVFTNGCFDLITPAHVQLLSLCASWGDSARVIVGLNSDESVRKLKGPSRPINDEEHRRTVLLGIKGVSDVEIFNETFCAALIRKVKPNAWIKGGDYTPAQLDVREVEAAREVGCAIHIVRLFKSRSTTDIIEKVYKIYEEIYVHTEQPLQEKVAQNYHQP